MTYHGRRDRNHSNCKNRRSIKRVSKNSTNHKKTDGSNTKCLFKNKYKRDEK